MAVYIGPLLDYTYKILRHHDMVELNPMFEYTADIIKLLQVHSVKRCLKQRSVSNNFVKWQYPIHMIHNKQFTGATIFS